MKIKWKAFRVGLAFCLGACASNIDRILDKLIYQNYWDELVKSIAKVLSI